MSKIKGLTAIISAGAAVLFGLAGATSLAEARDDDAGGGGAFHRGGWHGRGNWQGGGWRGGRGDHDADSPGDSSNQDAGKWQGSSWQGDIYYSQGGSEQSVAREPGGWHGSGWHRYWVAP
ncbi:MAG TPA: hypothetical protein VJ045_00210 [Hyphomicrobiaceae bacterium]|nr:hypothetical protein [Hyphomicrobiaceae bacterium]